MAIYINVFKTFPCTNVHKSKGKKKMVTKLND